MTHEESFAMIGALALGALDADEERAVMLHAQNCEACTTELAQMRAVAASLPTAPSAGVLSSEKRQSLRAGLVARAGATEQPARRELPWRMLSLAASLALIALGAAYSVERQRKNEFRNLSLERTRVADSLAGLLREKDAKLAQMTGPQVSVVELTSSGVRAPSARMFWDRATNKWTMYAHGLAPLRSGRSYELWLVTPDSKIPAGTFKPGSDGSAVFTATYALDASQLKAIAITEEPEAGVPAPTGPIVLMGAAGT
jgi:anti-sigma-K factor RskA